MATNKEENVTIAKLKTLAVYGYIREIAKLLLSNHCLTQNFIPDALYQLCLKFYLVTEDDWDPNCKGDSMIIDGNIISKTCNGYQSAFLVNRVSSGIHTWSFKIISHPLNSSNIDIGIWKCKNYGKPIISSYFTKKKNNGYAYVATKGVLTVANSAGRYGRDYGKKCRINDIIEMYLDLDQLKLKYIVNGYQYQIAYHDIEKTTYRAVVDMYSKHDQIELISYQQINDHDSS